MDKKICMITRANSGIGKAAARRLLYKAIIQFSHVVIRDRCKTALREIEENSQGVSLELMDVDMSLQASIRGFSKKLFPQV